MATLIRSPWAVLTLLVASASLCACGGDGGVAAAPSSTNPAGFYTGTLLSSTSGKASAMVALASDTGELRIMDPAIGLQFVASMQFADDSLDHPLTAFAAPGTTFPDGSQVCHGTVSGVIEPGATITGSYSCGGDHGTFSLLYDVEDSLQEPGRRFPEIGALGTLRPGEVLFISVGSDGSITGSDSAGCSYAGQLQVVDPLIDIYRMALDQTCGGQTLALMGLATFGFVPDTATQAIYVGLSDGTHSIAGTLLIQ